MFDQKLTGRILTWGAAMGLLLTVWASPVRADGIYGNGTGARSMSMGGTDVAWAESPLEAMGDNPAGLGFLTENEFDLGGVGAITEGQFNKPSTASSGDLNDTPAGLPEAALGFPLGNSPVSVGISFIPESMLLADWKYRDPTNSNGISYGEQTDKSEIIVLRTAFGLGVALTPKLSLGGSIGVVYNQNELQTPYVFQNLQPPADAPYDGAKTLLNLDTSGFGWNAQVGLLYRPLTNLQFGISYQNQYTVGTSGSASGDPYAQFGVPPGPLGFHYDAEVNNTFPQQVGVGASWKFHPQWRLALQVDWIGWSDAFNTLPVILSNGNNPKVNGVLGSSFRDNIPLNWQDEFVYRAGLEYAVTENLYLRGGYSYGNSPVPDSTLTPMTAAIMENTVTAGIGYRWRQFQFDLAYQYDLPVTRNVGTSGLLSGEYSNSSTEAAVQWIALTTSIRF
jgi:long-chain fatty acid transport protein